MLKTNRTLTDEHNVNVTLPTAKEESTPFSGKEFPCPLCGSGLPILNSKRNKPYFICNLCGLQVFVRGKCGISRLKEMADRKILVSNRDESVARSIFLLNRLEQLRLQKRDLREKQGFILIDKNVENAISLVDVEIEKIEGELAKITVRAKGEINK